MVARNAPQPLPRADGQYQQRNEQETRDILQRALDQAQRQLNYIQAAIDDLAGSLNFLRPENNLDDVDDASVARSNLGAVAGPISSTDKGIATYSGVDGKTLQSETSTLDDGRLTASRADNNPHLRTLRTGTPATGTAGHFFGSAQNDASADTDYASIDVVVDGNGAGAENGRWSARTKRAGAMTTEMNIGGGVYSESVTGGAKGVGTVNYGQLWEDNVRVLTTATGAPISHNHDDRYYTETESDARFCRTLASGSLSNVADLSLDLTAYAAYSRLILSIDGMAPATNDADPYLTMSNDGGSTWLSSGYSYILHHSISSNSSGFTIASTSAAQIILSSINVNQGWSNTGDGMVEIEMNHIGNASTRPSIFVRASQVNPAAGLGLTSGSGFHGTAAAWNAIKIAFSTGNIAAGQWRLMGTP